MTFGEAFYLIKNKLSSIYIDSEAAAIAQELMGTITQLSKIDRLMLKDEKLNTLQENELDYMLDELLQGRPLQYVQGKTCFMNKEFFVDENVLIPRPETEELVIWILNTQAQNKESKNILEIGTGTGCIPISIKAEWPEAIVDACDISEAALKIAKKNARNNEVSVNFFQQDILDKNLWNEILEYDIIVSNPPYIPSAEEGEMDINVKSFEPRLALFVADNDQLIFYRNIAQLAALKLKKEGAVYCEIHQDFSEETKAVFIAEGFTNIELRKDMNDNWRMIKVMW